MNLFSLDKIKNQDKASYQSCGGVVQQSISAYKITRYFTVAGNENVVKHNAKFGLTDGAGIGVNALVVADIEPYAIVGGVPARFIRYMA